MEGGVVEADRAVIEGLTVSADEDPVIAETGTNMVLKEDKPPKVSPGD
jgi:hypothetical protein